MYRSTDSYWLLKRGTAAIFIGAYTTVATSWGFAAWEQRNGGVYWNPDAAGVWVHSANTGVEDPITPLIRMIGGAPLARSEDSKIGTSLVRFLSGTFHITEVRLWTFGWPFRCAKFAEEGEPAIVRAFHPRHTSTWINGLVLEPAQGYHLVLPLRIRPAQAAADVGFWSALFGALLIGAPLARAANRRRRGHCPACGYHRSTIPASNPCPECGDHASDDLPHSGQTLTGSASG